MASNGDNPLLNPEQADEQAPDRYQVQFDTTKGPFTVEIYREWAPRGADRFYNLVKLGFFDEVRFFRVLDGFVAQFGINGDPDISQVWRTATIPDDEVKKSNKRGTLTFATSGEDSRTTQLFVNYRDNSNLDASGFAPIGKVVEGMDVVDSFEDKYGEGAPRGNGPHQQHIQTKGNEYLEAEFPDLDYIESTSLQESS